MKYCLSFFKLDAVHRILYNVFIEDEEVQEMECSYEVKKLRDAMGMNRAEFCEYFKIPYRTVYDWEAGKRKMPEYVFYLMKFKAETEKRCLV